MANLILPTDRALPAFSYQVQLDGTTYTLRYTFNDRMNKWFVGINTELDEVIVAPVPIVAEWPLFNRFQDQRLPPGSIFAYDTSRTNTDPERFDLGERVIMIYREEGT